MVGPAIHMSKVDMSIEGCTIPGAYSDTVHLDVEGLMYMWATVVVQY